MSFKRALAAVATSKALEEKITGSPASKPRNSLFVGPVPLASPQAPSKGVRNSLGLSKVKAADKSEKEPKRNASKAGKNDEKKRKSENPKRKKKVESEEDSNKTRRSSRSSRSSSSRRKSKRDRSREGRKNSRNKRRRSKSVQKKQKHDKDRSESGRKEKPKLHSDKMENEKGQISKPANDVKASDGTAVLAGAKSSEARAVVTAKTDLKTQDEELQADEEARKRKLMQLEAKQRMETEWQRVKEEEEIKKKEEEIKRKEQEELERKRQEDIARRKAEEELERKRKAEERARKKAEEEAARKRREEEEAERRKRKEEEAAKRRAEEEEERKQREKKEEERRKRKEEEAAKRRAEEEEERKQREKKDEERRKRKEKEEDERRRRDEEEAAQRLAIEVERRKREEEEARKKAEIEAEEERRRQARQADVAKFTLDAVKAAGASIQQNEPYVDQDAARRRLADLDLIHKNLEEESRRRHNAAGHFLGAPGVANGNSNIQQIATPPSITGVGIDPRSTSSPPPPLASQPPPGMTTKLSAMLAAAANVPPISASTAMMGSTAMVGMSQGSTPSSASNASAASGFATASPIIREAMLGAFIQQWRLDDAAKAELLRLDPGMQQRAMEGFTGQTGAGNVSLAFIERIRCVRAETASVLAAAGAIGGSPSFGEAVASGHVSGGGTSLASGVNAQHYAASMGQALPTSAFTGSMFPQQLSAGAVPGFAMPAMAQRAALGMQGMVSVSSAPQALFAAGMVPSPMLPTVPANTLTNAAASVAANIEQPVKPDLETPVKQMSSPPQHRKHRSRSQSRTRKSRSRSSSRAKKRRSRSRKARSKSKSRKRRSRKRRSSSTSSSAGKRKKRSKSRSRRKHHRSRSRRRRSRSKQSKSRSRSRQRKESSTPRKQEPDRQMHSPPVPVMAPVNSAPLLQSATSTTSCSQKASGDTIRESAAIEAMRAAGYDVEPEEPVRRVLSDSEDEQAQPTEEDPQRLARLSRHKAVRAACMQDDSGDSDVA